MPEPTIYEIELLARTEAKTQSLVWWVVGTILLALVAIPVVHLRRPSLSAQQELSATEMVGSDKMHLYAHMYSGALKRRQVKAVWITVVIWVLVGHSFFTAIIEGFVETLPA